MAQVVPVAQAWSDPPVAQAVAIATPPTAPQYREVTLGDRLKAMPRWQKAILIIVGVAVVGVVAFMLLRSMTGCGCPAGYSYFDSSRDETRCRCNGTPLGCQYNCGNGNCFDQGEPTQCTAEMGGPPADHDEAPETGSQAPVNSQAPGEPPPIND